MFSIVLFKWQSTESGVDALLGYVSMRFRGVIGAQHLRRLHGSGVWRALGPTRRPHTIKISPRRSYDPSPLFRRFSSVARFLQALWVQLMRWNGGKNLNITAINGFIVFDFYSFCRYSVENNRRDLQTFSQNINNTSPFEGHRNKSFKDIMVISLTVCRRIKLSSFFSFSFCHADKIGSADQKWLQFYTSSMISCTV